MDLLENLVDVGGVSLLSGLGALLFLTTSSGRLFASFLLLGSLASGGLAGGGRLLLSGFRRHFFQRFGIGETGLKSCVS